MNIYIYIYIYIYVYIYNPPIPQTAHLKPLKPQDPPNPKLKTLIYTLNSKPKTFQIRPSIPPPLIREPRSAAPSSHHHHLPSPGPWDHHDPRVDACSNSKKSFIFCTQEAKIPSQSCSGIGSLGSESQALARHDFAQLSWDKKMNDGTMHGQNSQANTATFNLYIPMHASHSRGTRCPPLDDLGVLDTHGMLTCGFICAIYGIDVYCPPLCPAAMAVYPCHPWNRPCCCTTF